MTSESMGQKVEHVRAELRKPVPAGHTCHWPGCKVQVPPAVWGCKRHWFRLPKILRDKIWRAYRTGQEITKRPSREYLAVADEVAKWIHANGA
jgi:hypothetical protein